MPDLLLPTLASTSVSTDSVLPVTLHQYYLQDAIVSISHLSWGTLYLQELQVNGFAFGYQIFQVYQPVTLLFICHSGSGILHYTLQENLTFLQQDLKPVLQLEKRHYCLGYHPPGSQLQVTLEQGEHHYFQLAFSLNFLRHLVHSLPAPAFLKREQLPGNSAFSLPLLPVSKKLSAIITSVFKHSTRPTNNFIYLNGLALRLTSHYINDARTHQKKQYWEQKKQLKMEELEAYIIDHLDTENKPFISLAACARKTGTSTFYFKKLFRQHYGMSPAIFIHKKRMEKAMHFITQSSYPAGDIYQEVGYENFSSFTRAFRAYFGYPPSYYRNT